MGCGGTKEAGVDTGEVELKTDAPAPAPAAPAPAELAAPAPAGAAEEEQKVVAIQEAPAASASAPTGAAALFPMLIAMLVMPFSIFKAQGRIFKSTKKWREEALAKQWLVEYDESSGKVVIFVSHT